MVKKSEKLSTYYTIRFLKIGDIEPGFSEFLDDKIKIPKFRFLAPT